MNKKNNGVKTMSKLDKISTKLTIKFEKQNYTTNNIDNNSTDEAIYNFASIIQKYQTEPAIAIIKTVQSEFK